MIDAPSQDVWFAFYLTLVPAFCTRFFAPSSIKFHSDMTLKDAQTRARWQTMWRSQAMCVLLVILLFKNVATLDCARLVFWYMAIDFACASWEVGGNLKWDNWLHHGSSLVLTGVPLLSLSARPLAETYGRSFLWMEWTTILLNGYYATKFYPTPTWITKGLAYIFMASFFVSRCLFLTYYVMTKIYVQAVPLPLHVAIACLTLIQWIWLGMMVKKLFLLNTHKKKE